MIDLLFDKYITVLDDFWRRLEKLAAGDALYRSIYGDKVMGCIAIVDDINLGYSLAYASGLPHRLSKQARAWQLVHSPSLQVVTVGTPARLGEAVPMTRRDAADLEPFYLGADPASLFDGRASAYQWHSPALFLYPENHLVPKETRRFVDEAIKQLPAGCRILVITKEPLVLTDFLADAILVLKSADVPL